MLRPWLTLALVLSAVGLGLVASGIGPGRAEPLKRIVGTAKNDILRGTPAADDIFGRAGNDTIYGLAGNDRLYGGPGNDRIYGGPGDDRIWGGPGADRINCGPGNDTVFGDTSDIIAGDCEDVRVPEPTPPSPSALCLGQRATIVGTSGDDLLTGTPGNDVIAGLAGHDTIDGSDGDDVLCGDDGNDRIFGGAGRDTIDSGTGTDVCVNGEAGENCSAAPTFSARSGASEADYAALQTPLSAGARFFREQMGVAIDGFAVVLDGTIGDDIANSNNFTITIWTRNARWQQAPLWDQYHILHHEYFHIVQQGLSRGRSSFTPPGSLAWLHEGSPEFVGYSSVAYAGLGDFNTWRLRFIGDTKAITRPLSQCEERPGGRTPDECYILGLIAVDFLLRRSGGPPALIDFYRFLGDGVGWRDSFQRAFGRSVETFYVEFEAYRKTL